MLGLAACAGTPARYYAGNVKAAQAANRPVVVYRVGSVYRYAPSSSRERPYVQPCPYTDLDFINASQQPIRKLTFTVTYYRDAKPVFAKNGKPLDVQLNAIGPFLSDGSRAMAAETPELGTITRSPDYPHLAVARICPQLSGIEGVYEDGTKFSVTPQEVGQYLTSSVKAGYAQCALPLMRMPGLLSNLPPALTGSSNPAALYGAGMKPSTATGRGRG